MENIKMISIEKIHNHPDNPRKDVGDVTELADSIKHSGIMQNLTVVPFGDEYRVIIGHRRLAASKIAGLTELPCVIVEMSEKEQLATMLSENMQRVDLTVSEQAHGMQLMFDLGESVAEISKKTGLSKNVVKGRIKIASLPIDKLKEAEGRGGTIEEYLKCCEIEDEKERAALLDMVGTRDFAWKYQAAVNKQQWRQNMPLVKKILEEKGIKPLPDPNDRWSGKYESAGSLSPAVWDGKDFSENMKEGKEHFYYSEGVGNCIRFYTKVEKKKSRAPKKSKKEIEADRRRKELKDLTERAYKLREEFVLWFPSPKKYEKVIIEYLVRFTAQDVGRYYAGNLNMVKKAIGDVENTGYYPNKEKFDEFMKKSPMALLVLTYFKSDDSEQKRCYGNSWNEQYPPYSQNSSLELVYEFLGKLGYQISTEEQKLLDGTHELYAVDEGK